MSQAWFVGPVARDGSGDCGVYVGFVVAALCYAVLRGLEKLWDRGRERGLKVREVEVEDGLKA